MDMRFLYDADRRLFAIGYQVGAPLTFSSHYDLLASEARLTSLVAIAKGDVPVNTGWRWDVRTRRRTARFCFPGAERCLST